MNFDDLFRVATERAPYPYQRRLAAGRPPAVLEIPTGLGKTEATVLSWLYRRQKYPQETPRRLLYCLPMRSLVEQTRDRVTACFANLAAAGIPTPPVEIVVGGDVGEEWYGRPEDPHVVIGTQDMLLSRALNRGYGMSRFQWPMTFAAANDDVYWVVDEVQLQGIGAVTATQLHAFHERLGTYHASELTLASATIDRAWFETADYTLSGRGSTSLDDDDLNDANVRRILNAPKQIEAAAVRDIRDIASLAIDRHRAGTLTLVVLNRVSRAQEAFHQLQRLSPEAELILLHSRYRQNDRAQYAAQLLAPLPPSGPGRIVVATQVVEAGVDVSAATLITDVAPWASLVQRFGRCNRRGEEREAVCIWLDSGAPHKASAMPYDADDIVDAYAMLKNLEGASAAPADLPKRTIPLRGGIVIRKPEFLDLFDTSTDLSGHDVDVSPYIRESDDVTVSLFWRDEPPAASESPRREELCAAPVAAVRNLVRRLRGEGHGSDARSGNQFAPDADHSWTSIHESEVRPGIVVWLRSDVGWYDSEIGFGSSNKRVTPIPGAPAFEIAEACPAIDSDTLSEIGVAVTLSQHARDTFRHAQELTAALACEPDVTKIVTTAARWHDTGKAHHVFQKTMRDGNGSGNDGEIWAKSARHGRHARRGFRHELPGALAYLHANDSGVEDDAIAYLIASHHGKARVAIGQMPYEAACDPFQILGIVDGDELPAADLGDGVAAPRTVLSLAPFNVGAADTVRLWIDRAVGLRDHEKFGPFRLAYLELLVRIADWRASKEEKVRK